MTRPDPACERAGLLLSLRTDGAATLDQNAELEGHVAACDACRRGARVDAAVGDRLRQRAAGDVPPGFAAAVAAAAVAASVAQAAAQNRFLRWAAAAAVFVAAVSVAASALHEPQPGGSSAASVRDAARDAVFRPRAAAPIERK